MPAQYKALISVMALIVSGVAYYFDSESGGGTVRWVDLVIGPMAVIAIWMFPEPKAKAGRGTGAGETRTGR